MNQDQVKGRANEAKGKSKEVAGKAAGDKSAEHKEKNKKHGSNDGAVLADLNDDEQKGKK